MYIIILRHPLHAEDTLQVLERAMLLPVSNLAHLPEHDFGSALVDVPDC